MYLSNWAVFTSVTLSSTTVELKGLISPRFAVNPLISTLESQSVEFDRLTAVKLVKFNYVKFDRLTGANSRL